MDDFAQGAALIGTQEALSTLSSTVDPKRLASGAANSGGGQGGQMMLGAPSSNNRSSTKSGMDTTMQAQTDLAPGKSEPEDD